jgi:hypothetical protein
MQKVATERSEAKRKLSRAFLANTAVSLGPINNVFYVRSRTYSLNMFACSKQSCKNRSQILFLAASGRRRKPCEHAHPRFLARSMNLLAILIGCTSRVWVDWVG